MTDHEPPYIHCMYDKDQPCFNCTNHRTNLENMRKLTRTPYVRQVMNREGIDEPTVTHIDDLITQHDNPHGTIYSDATERIVFISPNLRKLGRHITQSRRDWMVSASESERLNINCPVMNDELKNK